MTEDNIDIKEFEKKSSIKFDNKNLLIHALTHKSYASEHGRSLWNERLEFLGDSVLSLIIADYLYQKYTEETEGILSRIKSRLVSKIILADMARQIGLGSFVLLSSGEETTGGRVKETILADTFEAVLGALFLDKGLSAAKNFVIKNLPFKNIDVDIDYKSRLQEIIQKQHKILPVYVVTNESGPEHDKVFEVNVKVKRTTYGTGAGKNKKEAEQQAAKDALMKIQKESD